MGSDRPHSALVPHARRRDAHGLIGTRPGCLACMEYHGPDYWWTPDDPDMTHPTAALVAAINAAIHRVASAVDANRVYHPSPEQNTLLEGYFDVVCGDCETGRCHWGGQASADSIAAANEGREYRERCGCARHEVSVRWRNARRDGTP